MRSIIEVRMGWSQTKFDSTISTERPENFVHRLKTLSNIYGPPDVVKVKKREVIRVLIDRSFGNRHYYWDYPGTLEELETDWRKGRAPLNFYGLTWNSTQFKGQVKEIPVRPADSEYDCYAHVHGTDDTYLWVGSGQDAIAPEMWTRKEVPR